MVFTVYRLRRFGVKLPADRLKATGTRARLRFETHPVYRVQMRATLYDAVTGEALDCTELESAMVTKITDRGIMIRGYENHPGGVLKPQLWWCEAAA